MASSTSPFSTLKRAAQAFFKHDVVLKRDDAGVRVVLAERPSEPPPRAARREAPVLTREQRELALARRELAELLDRGATLRSTLRHLAFLEHALAKKGWDALHKLPLDVLSKALEQFETMVTNWSPVGLASLRSRMAVAVMAREHSGAVAGVDSDVAPLADEGAAAPSPAAAAGAGASSAPSEIDDDAAAALLAAYAATGLGDAPDSTIELQGELGSPSGKSLARGAAYAPAATAPAEEVRLRDLPA